MLHLAVFTFLDHALALHLTVVTLLNKLFAQQSVQSKPSQKCMMEFRKLCRTELSQYRWRVVHGQWQWVPWGWTRKSETCSTVCRRGCVKFPGSTSLQYLYSNTHVFNNNDNNNRQWWSEISLNCLIIMCCIQKLSPQFRRYCSLTGVPAFSGLWESRSQLNNEHLCVERVDSDGPACTVCRRNANSTNAFQDPALLWLWQVRTLCPS